MYAVDLSPPSKQASLSEQDEIDEGKNEPGKEDEDKGENIKRGGGWKKLKIVLNKKKAKIKNKMNSAAHKARKTMRMTLRVAKSANFDAEKAPSHIFTLAVNSKLPPSKIKLRCDFPTRFFYQEYISSTLERGMIVRCTSDSSYGLNKDTIGRFEGPWNSGSSLFGLFTWKDWQHPISGNSVFAVAWHCVEILDPRKAHESIPLTLQAAVALETENKLSQAEDSGDDKNDIGNPIKTFETDADTTEHSLQQSETTPSNSPKQVESDLILSEGGGDPDQQDIVTRPPPIPTRQSAIADDLRLEPSQEPTNSDVEESETTMEQVGE